MNRRAAVYLLIAAVFVLPALLVLVSGLDQDRRFSLISFTKLKLDQIENLTVDYRITYHRRAKADPDIVFLAIDTASVYLDSVDKTTIASSPPLTLMAASGFPYPREVYANVFSRLIDAGAKVVALDINFQKSMPADPVFKAALDRYRDHVVVGMNFSDQAAESETLSIPPETLLPGQDPFDDRLGFLNFWPDRDGIVREAQYRSNLDKVNQQPGAEKEPMLFSLAARVVSKSGRGNLVPNDLDARAVRFIRPADFPNHSLYEIFDPERWSGPFRNGDFFKGKIVLIGAKGDWAKDQVSTPLGQMNGAEVHLSAINALLQGEFLSPASNATMAALIVGAGAVAFLLALLIAQIAWRFVAMVGVLVGYAVLLMGAFDGPGWLLPVVAPTGVFCGTMAAGFIHDFILTQIQKLQMRLTFERYTSKNVARYLLDHSASYKEMLTGTRKPVTLLFSDVRNFTTMTEEAASQGHSQQHVAKLNEYLTAMVACVFDHDGSLDKFIGDAVMAVWGNTPYHFGPKEDAVRAVRAALAMLAALRRLNATWKSEGRQEWHIGIGLNHGDVIVGDMGSQQRKEFAVLGDAVNLASRLESLTKEYGLEILLGEGVADLVRDRFHLRSVDLVQVKGKTKGVQVFTLEGEESGELTEQRRRFLDVYEQGVRLFRGREFGQARTSFSEALKLEPGDRLSAGYLGSCDELTMNPPDATWSGVRVMTKK